MRRKLVKQGRNALTMTLPSEWVDKQNLKPGDEVFVEERKEGLLVSGDKIKEGNRKTIDVSGLEPMIKRVLGAIYKAGYDEVEVRFGNAKEFEDAQEVIREEFIGFETIHHGKDSLVFKKISSIEPKEFNTMMRRMFLIIKSMADDSPIAMKKKDPDLLKMIILRDKDVNKIADFCRRSLNSSGHMIEGRTAPLYFITEQLEKIGDILKEICGHMISNPGSANEGILSFFSDVNAFFEDFYGLYFSLDLKKMAEFGRKRKILIEKSENLLESSSKKEVRIVFYLREMLNSTFDMNGSLMAARL